MAYQPTLWGLLREHERGGTSMAKKKAKKAKKATKKTAKKATKKKAKKK